MSESVQHKLDRVRKPRVHITYDVEIGDAMVKRELPFVVGVLGDFSGNPTKKLDPLSKRKFIQVDRDNFNEVMASYGPRIALRVDNKLTGAEDEKLNVELRFNTMDDFSPEAVVDQVEPLRQLFEARQRLNDLIAKLDGNDDLDGLLNATAENTDGLKELAEQTKKAEPEDKG